MDEFEKWLDSQPILLQKNLSERDEAMKRDAFTAGRKSGYEAGLRRAASCVAELVALAKPQCEANYTDGDSWLQTAESAILAEIKEE